MFIIELCMERNFNFKKPDRNAPLHCACIHGQLDVVKYIFEHSESHGIDLDAIGDHETPLRHTAYSEHVDVFNYFLDSAKAKGIPICFRYKGGYSVVDNMSDACFKVLMERAIEVGFDINAKAYHGNRRTLQHWDYGEEYFQKRFYCHEVSGLEFRQSLFEYREISGLDLNARDAWQRTPISWTCACNKPNILETYLKLLEKVGPGRAGYVGVVMPVLALIISTIFENLDGLPIPNFSNSFTREASVNLLLGLVYFCACRNGDFTRCLGKCNIG